MRRIVVIALLFFCLFAPCVGFADAYSPSEGEYIGSLGNFNDAIDHSWSQVSVYGFTPGDAGGTAFNTGVDISVNGFTQLRTLADGYVKNAGYYAPDGGLLITIHYDIPAPDGSDAGMDVTYSNLSNTFFHVGERVEKGKVIASAGYPGDDSPAILHIGISHGSTGQAVDPALYFKDLNPGSADPDVARAGGFTLKVDSVGPIRDIFEEIIKAATAGLHLIAGAIKNLFIILITIDLAVALGFYIIDQDMQERTGFLSYIAYKMLFYGFLLFFLTHWGDYVGNFSRDLFTETAAIMTNKTQTEIAAAISSPTDVMAKGLHIVSPIFSQILKDSAATSFFGLGFALIIGFLIFLCFIIIGWHLALAYIEFYLMILFSFTTFIFAGEKHLRIHSENGINGIIASAINLMFFCFFAVTLQGVMADLAVDSIFTTEVMPGQEVAHHPAPVQTGATYEPQGEGTVWVRQTGDVSYDGAQPQTLQAMDILGQWFYAQTGCPLIITAVTNGDSHQDGERGHYAGWKIDVNDYGSGAEGTLLGPEDGIKGTLTDAFIHFGQSLGLGMNWEYDHIDISVLGDQWEGPYAGTNFGGLNGATPGTSPIHRVALVRTSINMAILLRLLLVVLMFMFIGDRVGKLVMNSFGSRGFTFRMNS